jgi:hypothetical protein
LPRHAVVAMLLQLPSPLLMLLPRQLLLPLLPQVDGILASVMQYSALAGREVGEEAVVEGARAERLSWVSVGACCGHVWLGHTAGC